MAGTWFFFPLFGKFFGGNVYTAAKKPLDVVQLTAHK
jgi:hypothetical protein